MSNHCRIVLMQQAPAGPPSQKHTQTSPPQMYPQPMVQAHEHSFHFPASPRLPAHPEPPEFPIDQPRGDTMGYPFVNAPSSTSHTTELDAQYWRNIFLELGFGGGEQSVPPPPTHIMYPGPQQNSHSNHQMAYPHMHASAQPAYGH